jgi:hypothetical protein
LRKNKSTIVCKEHGICDRNIPLTKKILENGENSTAKKSLGGSPICFLTN